MWPRVSRAGVVSAIAVIVLAIAACTDSTRSLTAPIGKPGAEPAKDWACVTTEYNDGSTSTYCEYFEPPLPPDPPPIPDFPPPPDDPGNPPPDDDPCAMDPQACWGPPEEPSPPAEYGEADASACWPTTDPGCKLKKPESGENTAFRNTLNAIKAQGPNCAAVAARGEQALNEGKVFMFDGPRSNPAGEPSVGDAHISQGEVHVSRKGFDGSVNTSAQIAQIFRHEVKHLLGWSHAQMQQPGYTCNP